MPIRNSNTIWEFIGKLSALATLVTAFVGLIAWILGFFPRPDLIIHIRYGEFRNPYLLVERVFHESSDSSPGFIVESLQLNDVLTEFSEPNRSALAAAIAEHLKTQFRKKDDLRRTVGGYMTVSVQNLTPHDVAEVFLEPNNVEAYRLISGGHTIAHGDNQSGSPTGRISLGLLRANESVTLWLWLSSPLSHNQIDSMKFIVPNGIKVKKEIKD